LQSFFVQRNGEPPTKPFIIVPFLDLNGFFSYLYFV
jgi:hypothetical protein